MPLPHARMISPLQPAASELAPRFGGDRNLIFDVGMNKGQSARAFVKRGFRVVSVEAHPELATNFTNVLKNNSVLNLAVADRSNETASFCLDKALESNHIEEKGERCRRTANVSTVTCADLVRRHGTPFLIKIDIEGKELSCVRSLLQLPDEQLPEIIEFESPMWKLRNSVDEFVAAVGAMERHGYIDWRRQWWDTQLGHRFIGNEVLDVGRRNVSVTAKEVQEKGCGLGLLPTATRDNKHTNICDFHASRRVLPGAFPRNSSASPRHAWWAKFLDREELSVLDEAEEEDGEYR